MRECVIAPVVRAAAGLVASWRGLRFLSSRDREVRLEESVRRGKQDGIRVTQVVFDFDGGGLESLVAALAQRFSGTEVAVSLITLSGRVGRLGAATRGAFDQFHVVRPVRGLSMLRPVGLARLIRQTRADVVHLHSGSWYKGAKAADMAGVGRIVYTEHGREHDDPAAQRWLDRRAGARTSVVVAVSNRLQDYLTTVVGIDPAKIRVVHNGVDTTVFSPGSAPATLRSQLQIPPDACVVGSVGRLEPVKAYERLIDAAAALRTHLSRPLVLAICGDGSQRDALRLHAEKLGINDMVRLPGWTDDPASFYRLLDVFVLSSRSEGESVSLIEAMACAIPPVVTDVGANSGMLGPELREQVVPVERTDALVHAIAATMRVPARAREIGELVRRRAVQHYSLGRMVAEYESLYRGDSGRDPARREQR